MPTSKFEEKCRKIIEEKLGVKFVSSRPSFLKNPETGRCLELDLYNESLKLAFEVQGIQHYQFPNYFHKTKEEFMEQIRRDRYKKEVCKILSITFIVIPYKFEGVNLEDKIEKLLKEKKII